MKSIGFWLPYLGIVFVLLLLAVGISFLMDWLEQRKRERAFVIRHRTRALRAIGDAHRRNLEELALETERRRADLKEKGAGASTPTRNSIH